MEPDAAGVLKVGDSAPAFVVRDQKGRPHRLQDYRNRPVALVFLPDLKAASLLELRALNRAIRRFDTLAVKVFAVTPADAPTAKRVHTALRLNFPLLVDPDRRLAAAYGAQARGGPPRRVSYVVGGNGRVMLPITIVQIEQHGQQVTELAECLLDKQTRAPSRFLGRSVADFSLPRVSDGRPTNLYGDGRQKATVLLVMSAQCPCSGQYDARLRALAAVYGRQGVRFIGLNASANETQAEIARHAKAAGFPFPVLRDAGHVVADRIEAQVTPEAFVMDAEGKLCYHGRIDDSRDPTQVKAYDLRNALDMLMAGERPRRSDVPAFGCAIYRGPLAASSR